MPKSEEAKAIETLTKVMQDILAELRAMRRDAQRTGR